MQHKESVAQLNSRGFGVIDFVIIGFVLAIIIFVVISNILARAY